MGNGSNFRSHQRRESFFLSLQSDLCEAMRVFVRYDQPDEGGTTRRERAEHFGQEDTTPDFDLPRECNYLWVWYWAISHRLRRVRDGACEPIPPTEFLAWCTASGTIISHVEYAILCAMDETFCKEMNSEIADYRTRQEEERKKEAEKARRRK